MTDIDTQSELTIPLMRDLDRQFLRNRYRECVKHLKIEVEGFVEFHKTESGGEEDDTQFNEELSEFNAQIQRVFRLSDEEIAQILQVAEDEINKDICAQEMWTIFLVAFREVLNGNNQYVVLWDNYFRSVVWDMYPLNCQDEEYETYLAQQTEADARGPEWIQDLKTLLIEHQPRYIETSVVRQDEHHTIEITSCDATFQFTQTYNNKGNFGKYFEDDEVDADAAIQLIKNWMAADLNTFEQFAEWEHGDGKGAWTDGFSSDLGEVILNDLMDGSDSYEFMSSMIFEGEGENVSGNGTPYSFKVLERTAEYRSGNIFLGASQYVPALFIKCADKHKIVIKIENDDVLVELEQPRKSIFDMF